MTSNHHSDDVFVQKRKPKSPIKFNVVLNAGKIYTYQAGSTTPLATYTDSSGLIANT